jgi:hypothetical protein
VNADASGPSSAPPTLDAATAKDDSPASVCWNRDISLDYIEFVSRTLKPLYIVF